jgi:hypothetical protein
MYSVYLEAVPRRVVCVCVWCGAMWCHLAYCVKIMSTAIKKFLWLCGNKLALTLICNRDGGERGDNNSTSNKRKMKKKYLMVTFLMATVRTFG